MASLRSGKTTTRFVKVPNIGNRPAVPGFIFQTLEPRGGDRVCEKRRVLRNVHFLVRLLHGFFRTLLYGVNFGIFGPGFLASDCLREKRMARVDEEPVSGD